MPTQKRGWLFCCCIGLSFEEECVCVCVCVCEREREREREREAWWADGEAVAKLHCIDGEQ